MTVNPAKRTRKRKTWRQKVQPYNTAIIALGLFVDGMVGVLTVFSETPPFDPVVYGMISATVKCANVALRYVIKTIQEEDTTNAAA